MAVFQQLKYSKVVTSPNALKIDRVRDTLLTMCQP